MLKTIKSYVSAFSVSGNEDSLRKIIEEDIKSLCDSLTVDPVGNLIAYKKGKDSSKKLMIAAHMDEIGFIVTNIEDSGLIRVSNIGGIRMAASSYYPVVFCNGVEGVIVFDTGLKPEDMKMEKMFIDIGAKNKKETEKKVRIGDMCAVAPQFLKLMNNRYAAKAFDDRIGCAVASEALRKIKTPAYDTYIVYTAQEEVGCRGSKPAANAILPDYSIAVDVTAVGDVPGDKNSQVELGKGAAIKIKDGSVICSNLIINRLTALAEEGKIPYQYEILLMGGTDTSSMQIAGGGSAAGCISVPTRYLHTPVETIDLGDVKACVDLLAAAMEKGIVCA